MLKLIVSIYLALTNSMVYDPTKIPYWADPRIHMFGNNNKFHALVAPIFTSYLDKSVYKADLRYHALDYFVKPILDKNISKVLDVGCGTGISSRTIRKVWPNSSVLGIDTAPAMLNMAESLTSDHKLKFSFGNPHDYQMDDKEFDLATVMYVLHEAPKEARAHMLKRLARKAKVVAMIDISPDYNPSTAMLFGEPYLLDYQKNINKDFKRAFKHSMTHCLIPRHAHIWIGADAKQESFLD